MRTQTVLNEVSDIQKLSYFSSTQTKIEDIFDRKSDENLRKTFNHKNAQAFEFY